MTLAVYMQAQSGVWASSPFQAFRYPAGEWAWRFDPVVERQGFIDLDGTRHLAFLRGTSSDELIALAIWSAMVRDSGGLPYALVPYLPAARDDKYGAYGAGAYTTLLNNYNLEKIVCLDPHSAFMPSHLNSCLEVSAAPLVKQFVDWLPEQYKPTGVIIPDAGAVVRASEVADLLGLPTYQAHKHRDADTGILSHFSCDPLPDSGVFLVSDDICDGGGTFMGIAEATGVPRERLLLWVTHGVFSGAAGKLSKNFVYIGSTNSIDPIVPFVADHSVPVWHALVEQLNSQLP